VSNQDARASCTSRTAPGTGPPCPARQVEHHVCYREHPGHHALHEFEELRCQNARSDVACHVFPVQPGPRSSTQPFQGAKLLKSLSTKSSLRRARGRFAGRPSAMSLMFVGDSIIVRHSRFLGAASGSSEKRPEFSLPSTLKGVA
jgi:hypothetical protein